MSHGYDDSQHTHYWYFGREQNNSTTPKCPYKAIEFFLKLQFEEVK